MCWNYLREKGERAALLFLTGLLAGRFTGRFVGRLAGVSILAQFADFRIMPLDLLFAVLFVFEPQVQVIFNHFTCDEIYCAGFRVFC